MKINRCHVFTMNIFMFFHFHFAIETEKAFATSTRFDFTQFGFDRQTDNFTEQFVSLNFLVDIFCFESLSEFCLVK